MSYKKFENSFPYKWNVYEELEYDISGFFILSLSNELAQAVAVSMTGESDPEEAYFQDIINEFTNISVGNAGANLLPMIINISPAKKYVPGENAILAFKENQYEIIMVKYITLVGDFQVVMAYKIAN